MGENNEQFVIHGLTPLIPIENQSLGEVIYQNLLSNTNPVLINGATGELISPSDLLLKTCTLAEILRNFGYGPNTVISICSKNNLEFHIPLIASLYIGATIAPISFTYTRLELENVLKIINPKLLFCTKDVLEKFIKFKSIQKIILIDSEDDVGDVQCLTNFVRQNARIYLSRTLTAKVDVKNDTAFILSSSGTTGLPKGVMLTHWNMNTVLSHWKDPRIFQTSPSPITLSVLPFFHAFGLFITLIGIVTNSTTVFLSNFEPGVYLNAVQKYKATRLILVPPIVVFLAKTSLTFNYDLRSIREVFCGAAPLKQSTEDEFKKKLNIKTLRQGYGLTESSLAVMYSGMEKRKAGSSGKAAPNVKLAIRDLETGKFLSAYKPGEICIKGDLVMKGYFGNAESTRNTFKNGWLLTGDIAYYDEDEEFFITDRMKELIKYKAYQVAPAEIEALLLTHPEILDCGVVGVPNEECGELPLAFIVKSKNSRISEKNIQDFVKAKLSSHKWLRGGVKFVDAIPKNATGKILRRGLKEMLNFKLQSKI